MEFLMETSRLKIGIRSEIGKLEAVFLHPPGAEVENMTPRNVQRALYSDILNLGIARQEYARLYGVLSQVAKVYEVKPMLAQMLDNTENRAGLIHRICEGEGAMQYYDRLMAMDSETLASVLIEGMPADINTLTAYLSNEYYALYPLYNFYFTRDAAVTIGNDVLICRMANKVRMRESIIMEALYRDSGCFDCHITDAHAAAGSNPAINMEGGDILVLRDDILLLGNGIRTSSQGIDYMAGQIMRSRPDGEYNIIVQQLPHSPESFIHLDMAFTMLDTDKCMVFKPLILDNNQYQTVLIKIADGKVRSIRPVENLLSCLRRLGMDLEPVICGGYDEWDQEREQWHSGANTFCIAPGQVLTYARNIHTLEELDKNGFNVIAAEDVISGKEKISGKCAISIAGSELPRGGGGARCMTMPLSRREVIW